MVFIHAKTLEETKYKLKTSLGISNDFYPNCQAFPIYGTGQGSGNSPAIWYSLCPINIATLDLFRFIFVSTRNWTNPSACLYPELYTGYNLLYILNLEFLSY